MTENTAITHSVLPQQPLTLCYIGYFSQNIICSLAEIIRLQLEKSSTPASLRRKLFSSFVEMSQNVIRYSASVLPLNDPQHEARHGSIRIDYREGKYILLCSNQILPADIDRLRVRLEPLSVMTLDEIKLAYKTSLREETPAESKGADLGLLTVARDASEPLQFDFQHDEASGLSIFTIKAVMT
ncbi:hypothetical protein AU510_11520 [Lonsdalea britannica]|uniref:SiaB family protein kinase n=1 Tax=Lonsdalea britannica TaxID=1082704 RepID=UPI000A1F01A5|nr:SiaB family protein kinase [Lonsdalea britannica]OSN04555.1 hypothetical protein AU510_11520 [Lonsdalea britannica]